MTLSLLAACLLLASAPDAPPPSPAELTLAAALDALDRQNPTLAQAHGRADQASAIVREAAAALVPSVMATGSYVRNSDQAVMDLSKLPIPALAGASPIYIQPLHSLSGALALKVPLLVPSAWFDVSSARASARGAEAQLEASRRSLRAALASSAYLALAAEEVVTASERGLEDAAELARSASRRVQAGTAQPLDELRARTEQVRRESDLARARADLQRSRLALGVLLGRDAPVRINAPPPLAAPADGEDALVAEALDRRAELRAARAQVDAGEARVRSAWARLAPQLSASGSVFAADVPYPTGQKDGWRASLDLTWSLYDGGLRYGLRGEAEGRTAEARGALDERRLAISQEVRDAARDAAVAAEQLRLAEEQRRLADAAAGTARRSYQAGVASSLDVIDANDRLYGADVGLATARARLAAARIQLERAAGRGP